MKTLIAIDPGQSGGIAYDILHDDMEDKPWHEVGVQSMPSTIMDIIDTLRIMHNNTGENVVYLEDVHTMPGQGVASSGRFMRHQGCLETAALCLGYKLVYVRPQVWQKHFTLLKKDKSETGTSHKNRIKAFAQQRYPNVRITLATADALAILEYAKEKETNNA